MAERIVLVNGLPGSGKTTLATALAAELAVPLISKDAIKEALAAAAPQVPAAALGRTASELMWTLAAAIPGGVVLESWWFRPRDLTFVRDGLGRAGAGQIVEVWCDVPGEVARERYARRARPAFYEDDRHLTESWPRWLVEAAPLGLSLEMRVRTDTAVDIPGLARAVNRLHELVRTAVEAPDNA
ncbi:AAA family ATPase [Paractinoplanes hotanensis]|uniref:AAA family ATPase n=1 Tax=Paractinoplanes hotanensis TaxID=2906497 RepID=A0ABT0Y2G3_9ACTN|nr:AAA family ATPase [Actinoplanes hotanensis]MCM4079682.1 AAA family ATPase [Actinoplanes hotanensis]